MYQAGLILEGGGMRGLYTAGVLDAFLEENIEFSSVYSVSAGSCQGGSYIAKQKGRGLRAAVDYIDNPEYCSISSFLKTGNLFGVDLLYSRIPDVYEPIDYETFKEYKGKFFVVVTDVDTGKARYLQVKDLSTQMWMVRASSSLPLISRTIVVGGHRFLDGGVTDSIPIRRSIADGNKKNVVILTRGPAYRKEANKLIPLMKLRYPGDKAFVEAAKNRHIHYNETLDFIEQEEAAGRVFVFRPSRPLDVDRLEKDKGKLTALYENGLEDGRTAMGRLKEYLDKD